MEKRVEARQENDEYEVRSIEDKRISVHTGLIEFKIRWEGYPACTWEPRKNLASAAALIAKFKENWRLPSPE